MSGCSSAQLGHSRRTSLWATTATTVEAYLLDFDRDLYGQDIRVEFVERLRDEIKYPSVEALVSQIRLDIERGREILSER